MANQHFFKPLLPGFHSHLTIPVAFFLKNVEGKYEHKMAELRSDASKLTWKVKIDGQRLTNGWKEFVLAHDLRIGDILIFRQERDMSFHVTMLGPSCCEIQYVSCLDDHNNLGKIQRKKKVRKDPRREALDPSCFVASVTSSNLHYDSRNLPMSFARENGLDTRCGEMILMNEKGSSWTVNLKQKSCGTTYIRRGWRSFCHANGLKAGSFVTFKLIRKGGSLVLRLSPEELKEEDCSSEPDSDEDKRSSQEFTKRKEKKGKSIWKDSSSASQNRFVTVTLTTFNVSLSRVVIPIPFGKANDIKKAKKISLLDKHGVKWSTNMYYEVERKRMRLVGGWKEFCYANGVKIGDSIILELICEGKRSSVLKFCSKVKPEQK